MVRDDPGELQPINGCIPNSGNATHFHNTPARVAKLADAADLGSALERDGGSSPLPCTFNALDTESASHGAPVAAGLAGANAAVGVDPVERALAVALEAAAGAGRFDGRLRAVVSAPSARRDAERQRNEPEQALRRPRALVQRILRNHHPLPCERSVRPTSRPKKAKRRTNTTGETTGARHRLRRRTEQSAARINASEDSPAYPGSHFRCWARTIDPEVQATHLDPMATRSPPS